MNLPETFEAVCRAMSRPEFYPHPVSCLECRQTHISVVFLTGRWVYKLKKPKNLGFLDYRTLADRRRFCEREVALNQRLSLGVYVEVVAIHDNGQGGFSLLSGGEVVEYAVKMVQLPEAECLAELLVKGGAPPERVAELGDVLAGFYRRAETGPHIDAFGDPEHIRFNMEENFEQTAPFVREFMDPERWEFVRQVCLSFWEGHGELFRHRVAGGRIRDGHGDLRADHVYLGERVQVIDCIEFNERFRYGDAAADLAFLLMDLDHRGHADLGRRILSVYARSAPDPEIYALLDFYAAYRAMVRLKVSCLSLEQADAVLRERLEADIGRYLRQAYRYAVAFGRPNLWVFCGLPASGKSTLAELVCAALFMPLIQSDRVRQQDPDFAGGQVVPFNTGMYHPAMRGRVYARMLNMAQDELRRGRSAALDATFSEGRWREAAARLAHDLNVGLVFVHCACPPETIRRRLALREAGTGLSDARLIHFEDMFRHFDPVEEPAPDTLLVVDTGSAPEEALFETLDRAHALRQSQVETLLRALDGAGQTLSRESGTRPGCSVRPPRRRGRQESG
jgi:aminoglycoside phosphotransferase family enzyme/predicted kinase